MRTLTIVVLPLLLQVGAYVVVLIASRSGGSFMGLLALLGHGIHAVRREAAVMCAALVSLAIALLPPLGLLVFRALES